MAGVVGDGLQFMPKKGVIIELTSVKTPITYSTTVSEMVPVITHIREELNR